MRGRRPPVRFFFSKYFFVPVLVLVVARALVPAVDLQASAEEADDGVDELRNGGLLSGAVPVGACTKSGATSLIAAI